MKADFPVLLDACVLAESAVSDLFLRLSEEPRLLLPKWTKEIWTEARRTWTERLGWPLEIADRRIQAATEYFPEAMVTGYDSLVASCENHEEDKHVLAAAIRCGAETIVTFNVKDFTPKALAPWGITAAHPADYLKVLFDHDGAAVTTALHGMSAKAGRSLPEMLARLAWYVKPFTIHVASTLAIDVPDIQPSEWRRQVDALP
ncbi:MAG: hypothetical protein P4L46_03420 [Fimbriimonas sp.]|nr:hypothetical protein [Fimbriimonas sp.]